MWFLSSLFWATYDAANVLRLTKPLRPRPAHELYEYFVDQLRGLGLHCETGRFQETMEVELVNHGPVTLLLDSAKLF